ncbi:MAG: cytochrome c3 family protein [Actinomycetes bacterium]
MKIYRLKKPSLPKVAVLATGLAAAVMAFNMSPQAAQATPRASSCAGCHGAATAGTTTATPSTVTPAPGTSYTVAITLVANPNGGKSGYGIVPVTAGTGSTFGGNTGPDLTFTGTMTAPSAAGTYDYTVWTNQGVTDGTARVGSVVYSITVAAGSSTTATTPPATTTTTATSTPTTPPATTTTATTPPATSTIRSLITATATPLVTGLPGVHGPYSITTAQCGICHRAHTAQAPALLVKGSQSILCFSCHDGTGSNANVKAQYDLVRPVNNPEAREYYSHDAIAPSKHTLAQLDEFGGASKRHSECADCHNSHQATVSAGRGSVETATGWDASGRLAGVSGVSVVNGAAGASPAYTFLSGADTDVVPANLVTREYQLCFKCHSGFTTLTSNTGLKPSQYALDKGVEFNPANPSFHPVEAAGKNATAKMAASLAGTSPYKLWNFTPTSTIRCLNCHTSSTTPDVPLPEPGSALQPHTSSNRGILIRNYQDRLLKSTNAAYSAGDFALCYVCHGDAPFKSETATATNFKLHGLHLTKLAGKGLGGTSIDTAGDGQGNAICAECHFRLHSTTNKVGAQAVDGSRLVNFAPNVEANGTTLSWTSTGTGSGSCTLTCHGEPHSGYKYSP